MRTVITVEEAREIMGEEAQEMSDYEIERLIIDLSVIAKYSVKQAVSELANKDRVMELP